MSTRTPRERRILSSDPRHPATNVLLLLILFLGFHSSTPFSIGQISQRSSCSDQGVISSAVVIARSKRRQCASPRPSWVGLYGVNSDDDNEEEEEEDEEEFVNNGGYAKAPLSSDDELQRKVELQQQQINQLLSMMQQQQQQQQQQDQDSTQNILPVTTESQSQSSPSILTPKPQTASQQALVPQPKILQRIEQQQQYQQQMPSLSLSETRGRSESRPLVATTVMNPLKAMLFIDGTWLYYSIHERRDHLCPIIKKYGRGWQRQYYFDWKALPRIICTALLEDDVGWAVQSRPVEIARVSVFTSYKKDTSPASYRFQMYQEMSNANYDIHMLETVGKSEKCVDINIAVEMLHYATVPNAYDVALLLTGDKDFMPAMIRTRQKGRKVGLVSMRAGCNRALCESPTDSNNHIEHGNPNIRDYDVVWIEDYLDELIKPRLDFDPDTDGSGALTPFTLLKVVSDFILQSGLSRGVNSRDIGRYLKGLKIGSRTLLEELKIAYGGLYQYFFVSDAFVTSALTNQELQNFVPGGCEKDYWISLRSYADVALVEAAKAAELSDVERRFFDTYSLDALEDKKTHYSFSLRRLGKYFQSVADPTPAATVRLQPEAYKPLRIEAGTANIDTAGPEALELPDHLTRDYMDWTVARLRNFCREKKLKVSGTKTELRKRIQAFDDYHISVLRNESVLNDNPQTPPRLAAPTESLRYLESLVVEFATASGGKANSRDLGRYLAVNKASPGFLALNHEQTRVSALQELKESWGGLRGFLASSALFEAQPIDPSGFEDSKYAYYVALKRPSSSPSKGIPPQVARKLTLKEEKRRKRFEGSLDGVVRNP
jgi:NYN domain/SAP domain